MCSMYMKMRSAGSSDSPGRNDMAALREKFVLAALTDWAVHTPYFTTLHTTHFAAAGGIGTWADTLVDDLVRSGAAERDGLDVVNI